MKVRQAVFKYRWLIGLAIILIGTAFKLHGSSIGMIAEMITGSDSSRLFGTPKLIRTDEYAVFTQMALSQVRSGFNWFSDIWGYSPSDMFIIYGQPVRNLMTVFRPFSIGYLFLGAERGLSFYWISRIVVGFLVSFEFGRLLTGDKRKLSCAYGLMVICSPLIQWWFSTNELVEMIICGQAAVLILDKYIRSERLYIKILLALSFMYCGGVYVLALYPAWMIPFFYVFLGCAIAVIIRNRDKKFRPLDVLIILASGICLAACGAYIYSKSGDTIKTVMGTLYPGSRTYEGGDISFYHTLFRGWTSYIWGSKEAVNPCEDVCFISLFPLGLILSVIAFVKDKVRDKALVILNGISIFYILYLIVPHPSFIGRITFLSKSVDSRFVTAIGFVNLLILFRAMSLVRSAARYLPIGIFFAIISGVISGLNVGEKLSVFELAAVSVIAVLMTVAVFLTEKKYGENLLLTLCILLAVFGGIIVNPLERGLSNIYDAPAVKAISTVNKEDPGSWIAIGKREFSNIPAIMGADTISAIDTYPDKKLWEDMGLSEDEETWNRYINKLVEVGDETKAELLAPDFVKITLSPETLRDLKVKYIWGSGSIWGDGISEIYRYGDIAIWRID